MSKTMAVAGKGGVGKTTLAALSVLRGSGTVRSPLLTPVFAPVLAPVLAVDADPNTCLDQALGVRVAASVGTLREEARKEAEKGMASGLSKQQFLELRIAESLVEGEDFDYIAMGRPEGPGCYCFANAVLKDVLARIAANYPLVVVDNEAGLENLSRRLVLRCDLLVLVADPSRRGLETMARIHALALEMGLEYRKLALVVNRAIGGEPPSFARELQAALRADLLLPLPWDPELATLAEEGRSLRELPLPNPVWQGVDALLALL